MNKNLVDNNYLIIPNFISSYRANKLKEEFVKFSEENNLLGDKQSPDSQCFYNYISFLEILCEKTPRISEIVEETVLPTYTYSRVYKNGSTLEPHVDRDACEISLTLHLGGDVPWPIYIKTSDGKDQRITLNPGDAMMYLGCEATHWREKYNGKEYVQVFLHYVRSRGDKFYAYFDKAITNTIVNLDSEDCNEPTEKQSNIDDLKSNSDVKESMPLYIKPDNKLEDFVEVFDDIMPDEVCDLILNEYSQCSEWQEAKISNNVVNSDVRNCNVIPISEDSVISNNYNFRKEIDNFVYESISYAKNKYMEKYKSLNVFEDTGYNLLRYDENQFYAQHTDSDYENVPNRVIACSIQLNDDYEGGEFAFFNREMLIRSKKGSIIMFPSNFMYPHEIMPVIKGTRYSITTWLL
jgi:predicted 2-oxoglutarate/Fe(II)-dependent dioxygenase YbiX